MSAAIIGAGISGSSCAYFLKQMFDSRADITVFDKSDQVGGRLRTLDFNNRKYELGGSILHPSNLYMKSFLEICGKLVRIICSIFKKYILMIFFSKVLRSEKIVVQEASILHFLTKTDLLL